MLKGLAPSTVKSYNAAWSSFTLFCFTFCLSVFPISISTVCTFLVHSYQTRNLNMSSIRKLLAGIQFHARLHDPGFPSLFASPAIRLLLKGIGKSAPRTQDKRLPITQVVLHRLVTSLRSGPFSHYLNVMLEAVFLMAFYGFMRPGEFTSPTQQFSPARGLTFSDLSFSPTFYTLNLKHSKTGGTGAGVSIKISRIDDSICPFKAMINFLKSRPFSLPDSPLFILPNGLPMTKDWFRTHLASVVASCSLPPSLYTGHSFRIGAATSAAERGLTDSSIKRLGRWSSSAFESYIRTDSRLILEGQKTIAGKV